jgi:hypothetical protein
MVAGRDATTISAALSSGIWAYYTQAAHEKKTPTTLSWSG